MVYFTPVKLYRVQTNSNHEVLLQGRQCSPINLSDHQLNKFMEVVVDLMSNYTESLSIEGYNKELKILNGSHKGLRGHRVGLPSGSPNMIAIFEAVYIDGSIIYEALGLTEQQGRWVSACISFKFFTMLKKMITCVRTKRTTHKEELNLLLGFLLLNYALIHPEFPDVVSRHWVDKF